MYRLSLTTTHYDPTTFEALWIEYAEVTVATIEVIEFVATYKRSGYFTRIGDGWATAAKPTESIAVAWDRLTATDAAAVEAAEAQAEADYDAYVNR